MEKLFVEKDINLTKEQVDKFFSFYETLIFYNSQFNLTAITEKEEVYKKHFVDSALGVNLLEGKTHLDIGSGGGFPAVPLKILRDDISLTMLEATGKKCEFLKEVSKKLNLSNVSVINGRAEELAKNENFRETFDSVTARAVARLNILLEYAMPFVKVGGRFIAYKGDAVEELEEAKSAITALGGKLSKVIEYDLFGAKRTLIVIEKVKSTDNKYPRSNGAIRKKPL